MRTLIVSPSGVDPLCSKLREVIRAHLDPQGPAAAAFANVERLLLQVQPQVVAIVFASQTERGLEVIRQLRRVMSGHILAVGPASDSKLILRALQEGADHYVDESDVETGLRAILSKWQSREEAKAPTGHQVSVLGSCGGCGASTLAVNLAAVVSGSAGTCGLIDLKPGRGDLAPLLDLKLNYTLGDLCQNATRLDKAMFEKTLTRHGSGIHLLGSPPLFEDTRRLSPQGVDQALAMARRLFSCVVVDQEDCFHEEQVLALRQAREILLVCRLEFTSLRNARRILDHLKQVNIQRNEVRLVVNRHGQPGELPVEEAEDALGRKLAHLLPDDPKTINLSNSLGLPAVLKFPKTKIAQSLVQLARLVCQPASQEVA